MKIVRLNLTTIVLTLVFFISAFESPASAKINVVASVTNLASIAREVGGDKIKVKSIAKGYQDPHYVDAKPSYVLDLNKADLLIYTGLDLEVGWLPSLITGARNSRISSSASQGRFDASTLIPLKLDVPKIKVDRSMGDVHAGGNPHFILNPSYAVIVARGIADRFAELDPDNKTLYESNLARFVNKMESKMKKWKAMLAPYQGANILTYHKTWTYFTDWAGLNEVGTIEPVPGIPPSPRHVANVIKLAKSSDVSVIISSSLQPQKSSKYIADKTGITFISLAPQVGAEKNIRSYTELIDSIVSRISLALKDGQTL